MEVMEDGNLMDKVTILIQRDMEYYKVKHIAVIQYSLCLFFFILKGFGLFRRSTNRNCHHQD